MSNFLFIMEVQEEGIEVEEELVQFGNEKKNLLFGIVKSDKKKP